MITVFVHEVVAVPSKFFAHFDHYSFDVVLREVCESQVNTLSANATKIID